MNLLLIEVDGFSKFLKWPYPISRCFLDKRHLVIIWIDEEDGGRKRFTVFLIIYHQSKPGSKKFELIVDFTIGNALKFDCKNGLLVCGLENGNVG